MDPTTLQPLLEQLRNSSRECATVNFKLNWSGPEDTGAYLSAMENTAALERQECAWMVWGVDDRTHEVKGTFFNPFTAKGEDNHQLIMWLSQMTSPRPDFQFYEIAHPEGWALLLEIHALRNAPLAFKGVHYIRIDSHKTQLSPSPE